jgi:hypothetical protein
MRLADRSGTVTPTASCHDTSPLEFSLRSTGAIAAQSRRSIRPVRGSRQSQTRTRWLAGNKQHIGRARPDAASDTTGFSKGARAQSRYRDHLVAQPGERASPDSRASTSPMVPARRTERSRVSSGTSTRHNRVVAIGACGGVCPTLGSWPASTGTQRVRQRVCLRCVVRTLRAVPIVSGNASRLLFHGLPSAGPTSGPGSPPSARARECPATRRCTAVRESRAPGRFLDRIADLALAVRWRVPEGRVRSRTRSPLIRGAPTPNRQGTRARSSV